jgi:acetyltransferase-like isoleucine patch superfamily enzyme
MAVDASLLLEDAQTSRDADDGSFVDRVVLGWPERASAADERTWARGSLFKRAARFAVRVHVALQLRWYRLAYRMTLREVGRGCVFGEGILVQGHAGISVGEDVRINDYVFLQCGGRSELIIEDEVTISIGAQIMTGQYPLGPEGHDRSIHVYETVVLEKGVWIGANAVVLPGVRVGAGSVVAAGSVVSCDVPPGVIVAGSPARLIRRHDEFDGPRGEPSAI